MNKFDKYYAQPLEGEMLDREITFIRDLVLKQKRQLRGNKEKLKKLLDLKYEEYRD